MANEEKLAAMLGDGVPCAGGGKLVLCGPFDAYAVCPDCGRCRRLTGKYLKAGQKKAIAEHLRAACTPTAKQIKEANPPLCQCGEIATKDAGKSGNQGRHFCLSCWRAEFTDPRGDEP